MLKYQQYRSWEVAAETATGSGSHGRTFVPVHSRTSLDGLRCLGSFSVKSHYERSLQVPETISCSNSKCPMIIDVADMQIGDIVKCPACGVPSKVLAEFDNAFDVETVQPLPEGERMHHPARQVCPNCRAVLGVRAAICPNCKADVRTGAAVFRETDERVRNGLPFIMLGAIGLLIALVSLFIAGLYLL
jgi:hypothetical protein